jgi:hypothetical protein
MEPASAGMNPIEIFRNSLRISLRTRALWVLALLFLCSVLPAFLLAGGFGVVTGFLLLPAEASDAWSVLSPLRYLPAAGWIAYIVVTLALLTAASLLSWAVQAAMIRAADAAADGRAVSVRASLQLGKQRWQSLAKLAFTFGLLIQALGFLPVLLALLLAKGTLWGMTVMQLTQTVLAPVSTVLGIGIFLLTMSIALEDVRPRVAAGRVWKLIRSGWWGFLLAYVVQIALALSIAFVFAGLIAVVLFIFISGWYFHSSLEYVIGLAICVFSSPVGLVLIIFALVFSTVLFTLTYRATEKMG